MTIKLKPTLLLSLAINTLLFSGGAHALSPARFNIKLDGIGLGAENKDVHRRLFVSLGSGYGAAKTYNPKFTYENGGIYSFACDGVKVSKSGDLCRFKPVKYGDTTHTIKLFKSGQLLDTYDIVFTNLPVVQIVTDANIVDTPKVNGTFRLMSGAFKQDTGDLPMGVEWRGQTTQDFDKKSMGVGLGKNAGKTPVKTKLLDLGLGDDWILDASYADTSFARNNICMDLYNEIHPNKDPKRPNGKNAIDGHMTEAVVNGKYMGVFILNQHVGPTLLGLPHDKNTLIYKADYDVWLKDLFYPYKKGDIEFNFSQSYPKTKADYTPLKALIDFVANSSNVAFADNIASKIDLNSVADWYLLSKAVQASDNDTKNFFLVKTPNMKWTIIPWDYNATFGMFWDGKAEAVSTFIPTPGNNLINRLIANSDLGTDFNTILKSRWSVLKPKYFTKDKLLARFATYRSELVRGGADKRNAALWPQPGTGKTPGQPKGISNPTLSTTKYIDTFLKTRLAAMDDYINNLP